MDLDMLLNDDQGGLLYIIISVVVIYVCMLLLVRIVGKRSTSQMNNFDWIVTVAIGSTVASTIVLENLPLTEGLLSIASLLGLQYIVTKISIYSPKFLHLVHAKPTILFFQGKFLRSAMRDERVTEQEILAAIRKSGFLRLENVAAVVLETDAELSVLPRERSQENEVWQTIERIHNYDKAVEEAGSQTTTPGD